MKSWETNTRLGARGSCLQIAGM